MSENKGRKSYAEAAATQTGRPSIDDIQIQVNEVVDIMNDNVDKMNERGESLQHLEAKTGLFRVSYFVRIFAGRSQSIS
jgi:hypothetical protein